MAVEKGNHEVVDEESTLSHKKRKRVEKWIYNLHASCRNEPYLTVISV